MTKDVNYKINFQTSLQGIESAAKKIEEIYSKAGIKISQTMSKNFNALQTNIPSLQRVQQRIQNSDSIDLNDMKSFNILRRDTQKIIESIISEVQKQTLPESVRVKLEQYRKEIEELNKSIRSSRTKISTNKKDLVKDKSGKYIGFTADMEDRLFAKRGSVEIGNNVISSYTQLLEAKKKNRNGALSEAYNKAIQEFEKFLAEELQKRVSAIESESKKLDSNVHLRDTKKDELANLPKSFGNSDEVKKHREELKKLVDVNNNLIDSERESANGYDKAKDALDDATKSVRKNAKEEEKKDNILKKATKQVITYGTIVNALKTIYRTTINTIKDMDEALTGMAVVTSMNREQAYELTGQFQALANQTGKTVSEIASMATKFYQQGKSTTQVLELTEAAAKAATIAGIDGSRSIDLLTNAMNGFQISASDAMLVSDKFAALAAAAATDYEELAVALSKVAAQANLAGMSMDFTLGLLTKGIEVTREAPETIGTALKTVIARMRELTDYGKTLEDGMDVNRVAKAFANIGVEMMDANGQFRSLEDVITEVGKKWDTLTINQQANVAVAAAGTRQQSRFIAMMQDFDRTLQLVNISADSAGATLAQQADYMEGLEAKTTLLTNAWQKLILEIGNSDVIITVLELLTGLLNNTAATIITLTGATVGLVLVKKLLKSATTETITETVQETAATAADTAATGANITAKTILTTVTKKVTVATKASAAAMKAHPILLWGTVIAGVIAGLGLLVAHLSNLKTAAEKSEEATKKLQVELYNLNNSISTVSGLAKEFEVLSSKVIKTTDDISRLKEIVNQINDEVGFELVTFDENNLDKAQNAISGFLEVQENEKNKKLADLEKEVFNAPNKNEQYIKDAVRTLGLNNIDGLINASSQTRDAILSVFENQWGRYSNFNTEKINWDAVNDIFNTDFIDKLDEAFSSGSLVELKNFYSEYGKGILDTYPVFKGLKELTLGAAEAFDKLGFSAEETQTILSGLGDDVGKIDSNTSREDIYRKLVDKATEVYNNAKNNPELAIKNIDEQINDLLDQQSKLKNSKGEVKKGEEAKYNQIIEQIGVLGQQKEDIINAEEIFKDSLTKAAEVLGIEDMTKITDDLTQLTSTIERLNGISDLNSMSVKERMDLLRDYPELADAIARGYMTDAEKLALYNEELEKSKEQIEQNKNGLKELMKTEGLSDSDIQKFLSGDDSILNGLSNEQKLRLEDLRKQYRENSMLADEIAEGPSALFDAKTKELTAKTKDRTHTLRVQADKLRDELSKINKEDQPEKYKEKLNQVLEAEKKYLEESSKSAEDLNKRKQGLFEVNPEDSKYVSFINGEAIVDEDAPKEVKERIYLMIADLEELAKEQQELDEANYDSAKTAAELYIESLNSELEATNEVLNKKKEAYQEYFDFLDQREEEEENQLNRESLIKQIQALSGAFDGASKSKIKDLQKQLNDLNKEDLKAQREEKRNALLDSIDKEISKNEEQINKNTNAIERLTEEIMKTPGLIGDIIAGKPVGFSEGGKVNFTGLAMVHGTRTKPEAFLSARDTSNMEFFLGMLDKQASLNRNIGSDIANNYNSSITIEKIEIKTDSLNNNLDFKNAGNALAAEFYKAIAKRGINTNAKK